ncbi:hypothetical protein GCM10010405_33680 [Streptomyces macrosporus]|uniref:Uncharacterized protein n=1 Tax=Streptomyces macrosporus TaxID=44032 RepID=A0ABN3K373_9ACTN
MDPGDAAVAHAGEATGPQGRFRAGCRFESRVETGAVVLATGAPGVSRPRKAL